MQHRIGWMWNNKTAREFSSPFFCSTDWIKLEHDDGEQVAQFFQVITFPQREYCTRYATMNSN